MTPAVNGDDSILLDTNAIIYFLEGRAQITEHVLLATSVYYSVITEIELLSAPHLSDEDSTIIREFLAICYRLELTSDVVEQTIRVRRTEGLKTPDAIIAATALAHNLPLAMADKRLGRIAGLKVLSDIRE